MLNVAMLLEDAARAVPDRPAVVFGEYRSTYAEVDAAANRVANLLADRGVAPGDKVALACPNMPYFPPVYYGILKAGAVVVPLNVLLKAKEIGYHLADSDAVVLFAFEGVPEVPLGREAWQAFQDTSGCRDFLLITADPFAGSPIDGAQTLGQALAGTAATLSSRVSEPTDTAVILYTSGTTGRPKGAELSHANMVLNAMGGARRHGLPEAGFDIHLVALPLFHSFGQTVQMNAGFCERCTLVLMPRFDARAALDLMVSERITFFAGVPTMYWGLLKAIDDTVDINAIAGQLRVAVSGGSSMPLEMIREVKDRLHVDISEGYGLSETSPVSTFNPLGAPPRPGSIGTPVWGVEVKLLDGDGAEVVEAGAVGEIAIRGHNVMKGYYKRPDETAAVLQDGWFRSGDLATRDADGYYYIVDRVKDLIIRGGMNVYPREVEEVLMTHPAVSLAAVVGVADEQYGEEVKAFVVLREGATLAPEELIAWSREQMASYKRPRQVEVRDQLPMTATGKILKRALT